MQRHNVSDDTSELLVFIAIGLTFLAAFFGNHVGQEMVHFSSSKEDAAWLGSFIAAVAFWFLAACGILLHRIGQRVTRWLYKSHQHD